MHCCFQVIFGRLKRFKSLAERPEMPVMTQSGGKGCGLIIEGVTQSVRSRNRRLGVYHLRSRHNSTGRAFRARVFDAFCKALVRRTKHLRVGYGLERDTFLGPVISDALRKRYLKYNRSVHGKGHSALLSGSEAKVGRRGFYLNPAIHWVHWERGSAFLNDEPPGPTLLVYQVDTWEEAIALHNRLVYRPANALFVNPEHPYLRNEAARGNRCVEYQSRNHQQSGSVDRSGTVVEWVFTG